MKILSIIIPVYNVEIYLRECLDSVLNQHLSNYEVICVNDGSTDSSRNILEEYKQQYNELIIVDRANGGLSAARNSGLKIACGKYILFVDSDDFVLPDTIQKLTYYAEQNDLEVTAYSATTNADFEYTNLGFRSDKAVTGVEYYEEYIRQNGTYPFNNAWLYLYKRSFLDLHYLIFKEGIYHEDVPFNMRMFYYVKRISYLPVKVIYYRKYREGAITNTITRKHLADQAMNYRELYEFLSINKCQYIYFFERICSGYVTILLNAQKVKFSRLKKDIFAKQDAEIMKLCARRSSSRRIALLASISPRMMYKYQMNKLPGYLSKSINIIFGLLERTVYGRI